MAKAIIISIQPKWVAKILNGEKTLEIRKRMPKCDLPIDVYIYCTKNGVGLVYDVQGKGLVNQNFFPYAKECPEYHRLLNGKVVAKFTLNEIKDIFAIHFPYEYYYKATDLTKTELERMSCLSQGDLDIYLRKKKGYAWAIDNLEIFDRPLALQPFFDLDRPPQSYCYIEVENGKDN